MDFEEKVKAVKHIYHGHVVDLDLETVELPDGRPAKREIVKHPGAVAVVAITAADKMIFIRQWREPLRQVTLEVPAGKIEANEQGEPLKTAQREMNEETRYHAENYELLSTFFSSPGFSDEKMYLYHASNLTPVKKELPQDKDELLEIVALSRSEINAAIERGEICDAKTIMAVLFWQLMEQ
ncbi:ADP-ribose pyrophosphatase [Ligilactobacillus salitolerans]|uniref:ADP-ribose pyrophosphatase n=1 Tax=Ligilactobacillus salitolerans TaxID=1808352 RepID=A0A401IQX4_9LACO|nr:NUDIX hydrolase [Ligilactobacillus salitolerans]GBG93937.1 ADP-ribose pyrophosphatase [Ligilactobacillus salitolerans]